LILTDAGLQILKDGKSPEALLWEALADTGLPINEANAFPFYKLAFGEAMKNKWIKVDKAKGIISREVSHIVDSVKHRLEQIHNDPDIQLDKKEVVILKTRRKLVKDHKTATSKIYIITKGPKYTATLQPTVQDLTAEIIADGSWKDKQFKAYNFNTEGTAPKAGHLHPLLKVRSAFREIFLEMGFEEMPTNQFAESSFWNFDALFQPQQHPVRDAHDTFFLKSPSSLLTYPKEYFARVQKMHESGDEESIGWRYSWRSEEAKSLILRTHTTAISAKMLYKLAQAKPFTPKKYFSIDRVYRNESLDATHLAEFHQIEGLVADYDLTLADLIGIISQFFNKWGMTDLKFKPAYNPYTEPSMEVFAYHPQLKKFIEIGNSGVFRPEMLLPMGLDPKVKVIAWGLSLERPTMIRYGIDNIRKLMGHRVELADVYTNPVCDIQLNDTTK